MKDPKKTDNIEEIKELKERENNIKKEIKKQIEKQKSRKEKADEECTYEKKLEDIIDEESKIKKKREEENTRDYNRSEEFYIHLGIEGLDYDYLFSYLGSGVKKTIGEEYKEMISADTSMAWSTDIGDKDIMDIDEQSSYAIKQAANMLLGTGMNHISHEEKIKFDAFMTNPSNKIVFLINYAMLGMNYQMGEPIASGAQVQEVEMSNQDIKDKSMKNDISISLRFDTKGNEVKEYIR